VRRVIGGKVTEAITIKEIAFRGELMRINVVNSREAAQCLAARPNIIVLFDSFGSFGKTILIINNNQADAITTFLGLTSENRLEESERFGFLYSTAKSSLCYVVPSKVANLFHQVSGISDEVVDLSLLQVVNQ